MTFDPGNAADPFSRGFRALHELNEVKLLPGTEFKLRADGNHESVTYVREGSLSTRQRPSKDEVLGPGYYQRANSQRLMITAGAQESPFRGAHLFVSSMTPDGKDGETSCERKHHTFSDRRGSLRLIASPKGGTSSLRLRRDVCIYSSVLDPGHHLVHELDPGRGVWLHVIEGRIQLLDECLSSGDGASMDGEPAVSFTALEPSEILLFDLA